MDSSLLNFVIIAGVEAGLFYYLGHREGTRRMENKSYTAITRVYKVFDDFLNEHKLASTFADSKSLEKVKNDPGMFRLLVELRKNQKLENMKRTLLKGLNTLDRAGICGCADCQAEKKATV